jgi:hypothetical protein
MSVQLMKHGEMRAAGVDRRLLLEQVTCDLERIDNDHGPSEGVEVYDVPWFLSSAGGFSHDRQIPLAIVICPLAILFPGFFFR